MIVVNFNSFQIINTSTIASFQNRSISCWRSYSEETMKTITVIFVFLVNVLPRSDAAFTWIHREASVEFTEGETARLTWAVDVGSSFIVTGVSIQRGQSDSGVIKKNSKGIIKELSGRNTDLIITGASNVVNVTFILGNLVRNDEMSYKIVIYSDEPLTEHKSTSLNVLALPVLQFQPNQTGFCIKSTVDITCTVKFDKPLPSNFTFFINNTKVETTTGTLIIESTYRGALISKALIHVGAFPYTCQANNGTDGLSGISDVTTIVVKDPPHIISCKDNIVEEGSSLFWQCSANGSEPLSTSWHRGNNTAVVQSGNSLTIRNVSRADGGLYTFKASNGEECAAASKTVQLDVQSLDLRACLDVSYALVTKSCLVSIPADGFPKPNLSCDVHNATNNNYTICSGENVDTVGSNCYISNSIRSCNFTIPVFARELNNITKKYTMTIPNLEFKTEYRNKDSADFKKLKKSLEGVLYKIYKYVKYVIAIDVMEFFAGSIHVNFDITMVANVSDPLVPLQRELNRTQGSLDGQYSINRGSLRSGWFVPKPPVTTTEPLLGTGAIVGIAIGCVVFVILIIVLLAYCCYRKKKKEKAEKSSK